MNENTIFESDRGERAFYVGVPIDCSIPLPLTKDGFEAFVEVACERFDLPFDDGARQCLARYIHHLSGETDETSFENFGRALRKQIANTTSWIVDQAIKEKQKAAMIAESHRLAAEQHAATIGTVVKENTDAAGTPPEAATSEELPPKDSLPN